MRALFTSVLFVLAVPSLQADDWPQWMGPQRDGVWREDGIVEKFPKSGPRLLWKTECGSGYAGPAVTDGKLFMMDRKADEMFGKTGNERVLCLDAKTGKELWKHEYASQYRVSYPSGPRCTPTTDGDRVYTLGVMGDLYCFEIASGKPVWSKSFTKDYKSNVSVWGWASHPLIDGDKLICLVGGADKGVIAFDKKTGNEVWSTAAILADIGYCPPVIYTFGGKRQLIIWHSKSVNGHDPDTGKRLWKVDFNVNNGLTAPMPRKVGDDGLFITAFYNGSIFLKVSATSAEVVWKSKGTGERPNQTADLNSIIPTPVIDGDYVYGVCSYGQLRCLKVKTGERVWETMQVTRGRLTPKKISDNPEPADGERWSNAFLTPHLDRYFLFNEQGELIIAKLSPKGYEEIDRTVLLEPTNPQAAGGRKVVWVPPAFAYQCVFVRNDKEVVCYSLAK